MILCAASSYEKKYYLNPDFSALPSQVKNELQVMCVLYTEEVGGVIMLRFDDKGKLMISTSANEGDGLYDEIGAALLVKKLQAEKTELFESLEQYYELIYKKSIENDESCQDDGELTMSFLGLDDAFEKMTDAQLDEYFEALDDEEFDRFNRYNGFITNGYDQEIDAEDEFKDPFFDFKDLSDDNKDGEEP